MLISRYFNRNQIKGLLKAGDIILPGTERSPSFSQTGCIKHIDKMAEYLNEDDLKGLRMVLSAFKYFPGWLIYIVMLCTKYKRFFPGFMGAAFRMLEIGVKGAIITPYYSNLTGKDYNGPKVFDVIGWDAGIKVEEEMESLVGEQEPCLENPSMEDIENIFKLAREVQPVIRELGLIKRLECISNLKEIIIKRQEYILDRIQQDTKKSRTDALTSEIFGTLDHLDYLEKNSAKILADRPVPTPFALMGKKSRIYFEPLGTVLIISPWNYPFYQAIVPISLAFITGNSIVYKPSKSTPLKGLVEDLLYEAGFESGWVRIIYGEGENIGDALIDQRPDKIFFIGSQKTGKRIMERASGHLIPLELELGGKDPMIVFEDADLDRAAAGAIWGAFTATGQSCTSVERLYIQDSIYDAFKEVLVRETLRLRQKVDSDGNADIGPMTTRPQVKVISEQVADARNKGAIFLTGSEWNGESSFIPPMIIEGTTDEMMLNIDEIFGPLLPIFRFEDEKEAIDLANDSEYGLSASVWSANPERADRVARAINTGNVSINNVMLTEGNHALPFGGTKMSGIGRYKGEFGFYCFANIKSVLIDKNSNKIEANWFPYTTKKYRLFSALTANIYSPGLWTTIKAALNGLKLEIYTKRLKRK